MCVIIHQPRGKFLTRDLAWDLWKTNPDGGGFAWLDNDKKIRVEKFMEFPAYWSRFETMRSRYPNRDFLLHMRIATHGSVGIDNVHPFRVNEYTVMAHNGILHGVTSDLKDTDDRTDTEFFVENIVKAMPSGWLDNKYLVDMMETWLGWSKLLFLTDDPTLKHSIYRLGEWDMEQGLHLSNLHHLDWLNDDDEWKLFNENDYSENSAEWAAWYEYKEEKGKDDKPITEWEMDLLLEGLATERQRAYIDHDIIMIDDRIPNIECAGCLESINLDTATCGCWDKACTNCMSMLAFCKLTKECGWDEMVMFDNLSKEIQNEILGKRNPDILEFVPEGAGNTDPLTEHRCF